MSAGPVPQNRFERLGKRYARIAVILLNTLILLLLLEAGAAVVERVVEIRRREPILTFDYAPYRMMKMAETPFALNREGFRTGELEEVRPPNAPEPFVVVFLGGSVCVGFGRNPGPPLPELVERALLAKGLKRVKVVNLGQGGAVSAQELAILLQYGLPLRPALVVSFNGVNDMYHPRPLGGDDVPNAPFLDADMRRLWERNKSRSRMTALLDFTSTGRLLGLALRKLSRGGGGEGAGVPVGDVVEAYGRTMELTSRIARDYGAEHAVLLQPSPFFGKEPSPEESAILATWGEAKRARLGALYDGLREGLKSRSAGGGAKFYDLGAAFRDARETIYSDDCHFATPRGCALLLEALAADGFLAWVDERYRAWERAAPGRDR